MNAREEILHRIATATAARGGAAAGAAGGVTAGPPAWVPRAYRTEGRLDGAALLDLLADRLRDYRAAVHRCRADALAATVLALLEARGVRSLAVPPQPPADLTGWPGELRVDTPGVPLTVHDLDTVEGVLTGCAVAVAETGTLVLDASPDQGRRALTLVPDYHLAVVRADQVVHTVPEAVHRLTAERPLTWISGPSATSDIELNRVEGVHGPRTLEVVLVEPD